MEGWRERRKKGVGHEGEEEERRMGGRKEKGGGTMRERGGGRGRGIGCEGD